MSKIYLTESELQKLIETCTIEVLNEGKGLGKLIAKGVGYTLAGGPALAALKAADALANGKRYKFGSDKPSVNKTNASDTENKQPVQKTDNYKTPEIYNDNNIPQYCESFKYKDVLKGHGKDVEDDDKKSMMYRIVSDYKISDEEKQKRLKEMLEKRDKVWGILKKEEKKDINEVSFGSAVRAGSNALKLGRQIRRIKKSLPSSNTPLLDHNTKLDMIENEILPVVLNSLCGVLSIEKEDPLFQLITGNETKKKMMKIIDKEIR